MLIKNKNKKSSNRGIVEKTHIEIEYIHSIVFRFGIVARLEFILYLPS